MAQLGFFDADRRLAALSAKGDPLEAIGALVPWESFRADIEAVVLTPVSPRRAPPCSGSGYPRVCLLFLTGWGMRGCVHDGEGGHKWREAASEEVA